MNKNTIFITVIAVVAVFGFLSVAYMLTNKPQQTSYPEVNKIKSNDHVKWSQDKKNILVEYADLQCEACRSFHGFFKQWEKTDPKIFEQVKKNVTFIHRHFPLPAHGNSQAASYAAEAAGKQGKFFEYADILFTEQDNWGNSDKPQELFIKYAQQLKLDTEQFKKYMGSSEAKDKVSADMSQGNSIGVNSTPTFFLNGEKQVDVRSFEEFKQKLIRLK